MNEKQRWLFILMCMASIFMAGALGASLVMHENGHAAACNDMEGAATVSYDFLIRGSTTCEGLSGDDRKIYNVLSATHEMYTYQIGVVLVAVFAFSVLVLMSIFIMTDLERDTNEK